MGPFRIKIGFDTGVPLVGMQCPPTWVLCCNQTNVWLCFGGSYCDQILMQKCWYTLFDSMYKQYEIRSQIENLTSYVGFQQTLCLQIIRITDLTPIFKYLPRRVSECASPLHPEMCIPGITCRSRDQSDQSDQCNQSALLQAMSER